MATTELLLKIQADIDAAQRSIAQLRSQLQELQNQAVVKPDFSFAWIKQSFTRGIDQLKSNFRAGFQDVNTGVLGQLATNLGTLANPAGLAAAGIAGLGVALKSAVTSAIEYDAALTDVSVITGATGQQLSSLGEAAQSLALSFGGGVNNQLSLMSLTLSKIGPQLADNQSAFEKYLQNVNVFAKAAGIDAAQAGEALADVLLQLGVNTQDSAEVVTRSTEAINVMAKGAQLGAATVQQVAEAMLQAGSTARTVGVGIVEVNAAIQTLSLAGKAGSEAGVGLRNVLLKISEPTKEARDALQATGLSFEQLQQTLSQRGLTAALEQLRGAVNSIADPTQRAALLAKMFGSENVAAAGGLLANVDAMQRFAAAMSEGNNTIQGQGAAFEQAATRMRSWSEVISRVQAIVEVIAIKVGGALLDAVNAVIEIISPLASAFGELGSSIASAFAGAGDGASIIASELGVVNEALTAIVSGLAIVVRVVGEIVRLLLTGVVTLIRNVAGSIADTYTILQRMVGSVVQWVASLDAVRNAVAFIRARFEELVSAAKSVYNWLAGLLGLSKSQQESTAAVAQQTQEVATATQVTAEQTQRIVTNWDAIAARLDAVVSRARSYVQLFSRLSDAQLQQQALSRGLLSPTTEQRIAAQVEKIQLLESQITSLAQASGVGSAAQDLLAQSMRDIDVERLTEQLVQFVPAVKKAKEESEQGASGQEKYAQAVAAAREQVRDWVVGLIEARNELSKLKLDEAINQAKRLAEEIGAIEISVTPEMTLDAAAIGRTRSQLESLRSQIQSALQGETRVAVVEQLNAALNKVQSQLTAYERNVTEAQRKAQEERLQLVDLTIADEEERQRQANIRKLEQERDYALQRAQLYQLTAEQIAAIEANFNARLSELRTQRTRDEIAAAEATEKTYSRLFELPAELGQALASNAQESAEQYKRVVLSAALDIIEAQLLAAIFGVTAAELSSKGLVGLGTAAVGVAVLRGLFAAAKAALQRGFREGGWTGNGGTSDVAGVVHKREYVVPAPYAERYRPILELMRRGAYEPALAVAPQQQRVRVVVDGAIDVRARDEWMDVVRRVSLRTRYAV